MAEEAKGSEWEVDIRKDAKQIKELLRRTKKGEHPHLYRKLRIAKKIVAKVLAADHK